MVAAGGIESHLVALLLCLVVVLVLGRVAGIVCRKIKQPVVIGEILVGIALGPSVLGALWPAAHETLFSPDDLPFYKIVAQLGLVLFMFVVGLEVDLDVIRSSGRKAMAISLTSIALPFVLGYTVLAPYLYHDHKCVAVEVHQELADAEGPAPCANPSAEVTDKIETRTAERDAAIAAGRDAPAELTGRTTDFVPFGVFVAVSMCATAFAVLARILSERNMFKIPLGLLLIAAAAIDDIMAFTLLALATALAGGGSPATVALILLELVGFVLVLWFGARPLLERGVLRPYRQAGRMGPEQMTILLAGLLLSSFVTSKIGVHQLIGAFLFGVILPRAHAPRLLHDIAEKLEGVSVLLLLPMFFVIAGQDVHLQGLTADDIAPTLAILAVACVGKFVGGAVAARVSGVPRRQSLAVGTMMNTRGLAELVILSVGREAGVIDDKLYTMLVIMAIVTTAMAGPVLRVVYPDRWLQRDIAEAERRRASSATDRVAVVVEDPATAGPLAALAVAYGGGRETGSVSLLRFSQQGAGLASFADDLAAVQSLRATVEAAGLTCQVVSRATSERARAIVAEIERLAPGAVILGPGDTGLVGSITALGCDVVVAGPPVADPDAVIVDRDAGGAGLEMAARLALHHDVPLAVDSRLTRRTRRQLRALGLTLTDATPHRPVRVGARLDPHLDLQVIAGARDRVPLTEALESWRLREPVLVAPR